MTQQKCESLQPAAQTLILTREDREWIAEARDSVRRLDGEVLAAIDRRSFTAAEKLDQQRVVLHRGIAKRLGQPRPAS